MAAMTSNANHQLSTLLRHWKWYYVDSERHFYVDITHIPEMTFFISASNITLRYA